MKKIEFNCELSFVKLASYEGTGSTGEVKNLIGLNNDLAGRHVVIVEDIVDTGGSIEHMVRELERHRPASIEICTLFFKTRILRAHDPRALPRAGDRQRIHRGLRTGLQSVGPQPQGRIRSDRMTTRRPDDRQLDGGRLLPLVEDFYTIQGRGLPRGKARLLHPPGRLRGRMPVVRRQIHVESGALSARGHRRGRGARRRKRHRGRGGHGRRAPALPLEPLTAAPPRPRPARLSRNFGRTPFLGHVRLGVPLAQAPASAPRRGVRPGRRAESDRGRGARLRMGRSQRRARGRRMPPLPPARMERRGAHHARAGRLRQGPPAVERL